MQDKIKNADQSQKALFQSMDELLHKSKVTALPTNVPAEDQPDKFCNFFLEKKLKKKITRHLHIARG